MQPDGSERYSRQILLPQIGADGQAALASASALVVGCGALGSATAALLARAGVGRLRIVDRDFVELSNLQRQILFDEEDVREGRPKALAAAEKLARANSGIAIEGVVKDVNPDTIVDLARGFSLILDGTDNFETRFLINDVSVRHDIPWIYAACLGTYGLTMNILPGDTACLRCVMESAPAPGSVPTCDTAGILGPMVTLISSLQATEAIKFLAGRRDEMSRHMLSIDCWTLALTKVEVPRSGGRRRCETCDGLEFTWLAGRGSRTVTMCGRDAVQVSPGAGEGRATAAALDLEALAKRLAGLGREDLDLRPGRFLVRFRVEGTQVAVFPDGRAIISGTKDAAIARGIYARYVGA